MGKAPVRVVTWQSRERATLGEVVRARRFALRLEEGGDEAWQRVRRLADLARRGDVQARRALRLLRWSGFTGQTDWLTA